MGSQGRRIAFYVVPFLLAFSVQTEEVPRGTLKGKVVDQRTKTPLVGAWVELAGTPFKTLTDAEGTFLLTAPKGTYSLDVSAPFYVSRSLEVVLSDFPGEPLRVEMTPRALPLGSVVVTARPLPSTSSDIGLLARQQQRKFLSDAISAQWMGRLSTGDAGDALQRVTGVSLVGGKFVYVRGLGERYSNTQLNGVPIPSPEPTRRVVPMDIFPSSLLDSVETVKTFTPDQPGDLSGGSVRIVSKDFPSAFEFSFSASFGSNSQTTRRHILRPPLRKGDLLGFGGKSRALPALIRERASSTPIREKGLFSRFGFTASEIQEFGRSFQNEWSPKKATAPANQGYKFSVGNTTRLFGRRFGYVAAATYDNDLIHVANERRRTYRMGIDALGSPVLTPVIDYAVERTSQNVAWGSVANASLEIARGQKISLRTVANHNAESEARHWIGFNADRNTPMKSSRLLYIERNILSTQLTGEHRMGDVSLVWRGVYSRATRNEPDTREVVYEQRDHRWLFRDITQSGSRFFFYLNDNEGAATLDLSFPLRGKTKSLGRFQTGGVGSQRRRSFDVRRFRFQPADNIERFVDLSSPPETLFRAENLTPGRFTLLESTRATDNYTASHDLYAAYGLLDLNLGSRWDLLFGVRLEASHQVTTTFDPFSPAATPIVADLNQTDLLPSLNAKYSVSERVHWRVAVTRTVTRPDFREMAPFEFTDFVGGSKELGNPNLRRTRILNYDLRWEFFPKPGELVALSVFYKRFQEPIEAIILPQAEVLTSYANAQSAWDVGLEGEIRRALLRGIFVSLNAALISSRVRLPKGTGIQTSSVRPLQGQSPYVVNGVLTYEEGGFVGTVAYHVFGRRIQQVGNHGLPDIYELPRHQLDVTFGRSLSGRLDIRFAAKNLLNAVTLYKQGNAVVTRYKKGRSYSLSVSHNFS